MVEQGAQVSTVSGRGIVVRGNDIDTDRIIPARYMKVVTFDGLGEFAFRDVRFDSAGNTLDHPFNDPQFADASVLFVNKNFGCGSSREHAPQALVRWGIRAVVGESFAEIFAGNCNALGVPTVTVSEEAIGQLMEQIEANPSAEVTIDLGTGTLTVNGTTFEAASNSAYRNALMSGEWDSTSVLRDNEPAIRKTASALPYVTDFAVHS